MIFSSRQVKGHCFLKVGAHPDLEATLCQTGASLYQVKYKGREMLFVPPEENAVKANPFYFGQVIGPVAGRIRNGKLGRFAFPVNEGRATLHSASLGFSYQDFPFETQIMDNGVFVRFRRNFYMFQAEISVEVDYFLPFEKPLIVVDIKATPSKEMPLNFTSHPYFNLGLGDASNAYLRFRSSKHVQYDENNLPVSLVTSEGRFDFAAFKALGKTPFDHAFSLDDGKLTAIGKDVALELSTDAPFVLIYTGLKSPVTGKCGGFTLECMRYPLLGEESIAKANEVSSLHMEYFWRDREIS